MPDNFLDSSSNNFTVTANGNVAQGSLSPYFGSTNANYSVAFDGTGDYLDVTNSDTFDTDSTYTFEAWFYQPAAGNGFIFARGGGTSSWSTSNGHQFHVFILSGTIYTQFNSSGTPISISTTAPSAGAWHHVAVGYNGTTTRMWLDGVSVGTSTSAYTMPTTRNIVRIGYAASSEYPLNGYISNLRFVKGTDVYGVSNASITVPTSKLTAIANTALLTCQDSTFKDNSTNAFTITKNGDAGVDTFSPYMIPSSFWSAYFNGTTDSISVSNSGTNLDLGTTWTIETWVYPISKSTQQCILLLNGDTTANAQGAFRLEIDSASGNWRYLIGNTAGGSWQTFANTTGSVDLNTWQHIACVCNAGSFTFYKNGVSVGTASSMAAINDRSATYNTTVFGRYGDNTTYFNGYLSNARIIKGTALYTSAFVPDATPLTNVTGTSLLTFQDNRIVDNSSSAFTMNSGGAPRVTTFSPFRLTTGQWSGSFNGSTDYVSAASSTQFNFASGNFTAECWFNTSAYPANYATIITPAGTPTDYQSFWIGLNSSGKLYFLVQNGAASWATAIVGSTTISLSTWNHVAVVRNGTSVVVYLNGAQEISTTTSYTFTNSNNAIFIGGRTLGSGQWFNGQISNVRIVKGTAVYTSTFTPSTANLSPVTNTVLLTLQNPRFVDNSSNNFTVSATGTPSIIANGPFTGIPAGAYTKAIDGGSVYFDGTGDYLSVPSNAALQFGTGDFTIEGWIYPTLASAVNAIFDNRPASTNGVYSYVYLNTDRTIRYYVSTADRITSSAITLNNWYHIAVSRSGTSTRMFINGIQAGSTYTDSTNYTASATLVGTTYGAGASLTGYFNGYMADVRVVKGRALYTANFLPPVQPLTPTANTSLLLNATNPTFLDHARKNNIEPVGSIALTQTSKRWGNYGINCGSSGSNYFNIKDQPQIRMDNGNFCVEGWFKPAAAGTRFFYSKGFGTTGGLVLGVGSDTVIFRAAGTNDLTATVSLSLSSFTHVAFVRSGTTRAIYVNGSRVASGTLSFNNNDTSNLQIGAIAAAASDANRYYGFIDDLRVTKGISRYDVTSSTITVPDGPFGTKST